MSHSSFVDVWSLTGVWGNLSWVKDTNLPWLLHFTTVCKQCKPWQRPGDKTYNKVLCFGLLLVGACLLWMCAEGTCGPRFATPLSRAEEGGNTFHHGPSCLPPNILAPLPGAKRGRRGGLSGSFGGISAHLSCPGGSHPSQTCVSPRVHGLAPGRALLLLSYLAPVLPLPQAPLQAHYPHPCLLFSQPHCSSNWRSCRRLTGKSGPLGRLGDCFLVRGEQENPDVVMIITLTFVKLGHPQKTSEKTRTLSCSWNIDDDGYHLRSVHSVPGRVLNASHVFLYFHSWK